MLDPTKVRLGRKPPIHDERTLKMSDFVTDSFPPPPTSLNLRDAAPEYPIFGNDHLGDCTCAAVAHMVEVWRGRDAQEGRGTFVMPTTKQVIDLYDKVNGGEDNGAAMIEVLRVWRNDGFAGEKPRAFMQVEITNHNHIKTAMKIFEGLYVGISLPNSVKNAGTLWHDLNDFPGSWGGHAVSATAYDVSGITFETWGHEVAATWAWFDKYVEEVWAVLPSEWAGHGIDIKALDKALVALAK